MVANATKSHVMYVFFVYIIYTLELLYLLCNTFRCYIFIFMVFSFISLYIFYIQIYSPNEKKPFVSIAGEWSGLMEAKWHDTHVMYFFMLYPLYYFLTIFLVLLKCYFIFMKYKLFCINCFFQLSQVFFSKSTFLMNVKLKKRECLLQFNSSSILV